MQFIIKSAVLVFLFLIYSPSAEGGSASSKVNPDEVRVPILLYHRFGPHATDSMTVTTGVFRSHLDYLRDKGFKVIPLKQLVDYYMRKGPPPRPGSVVIVADDAHKSVFTDMMPLVKEYRVPVTLFVYPSAISNASYAMSWDQLGKIRDTGLFDIQSHTFWHPNFRKEKKRLQAAQYDKFVKMQLNKPMERLNRELGLKVNMLAWPFGIYDDELIKNATDSGYIAAFTIERRAAGNADNVMKLPRFIMRDSDRGKALEMILSAQARKGQ